MAWSLLSLVSHARIRSGLFRVTISWNWVRVRVSCWVRVRITVIVDVMVI